MKSNEPNQNSVLLYDGACGLCSRIVRFIIRHDKNKRFRFCALQSEMAIALLKGHGEASLDLSSVILIHDKHVYRKSAAVEQILKGLPGFYILGVVVSAVPTRVADYFYGWVARNRYRWFGSANVCENLSADERDRFIG